MMPAPDNGRWGLWLCILLILIGSLSMWWLLFKFFELLGGVS